MSEKTEDEFEFLRCHKDKVLVVAEISQVGERKITGKLKEVVPYAAILIDKGNVRDGPFTLGLEEIIPFIGTSQGIREITFEGQVLYKNPLLAYERNYVGETNKEDNRIINEKRREKFGEGHDIPLRKPLF